MPPQRPARQSTALGTPLDSRSISSWPPSRLHPWQRPELQRDTFPPMEYSSALSLPKKKRTEEIRLSTGVSADQCKQLQNVRKVFSELVHICGGGPKQRASSLRIGGHARARPGASGYPMRSRRGWTITVGQLRSTSCAITFGACITRCV